jgi:hypothetical protein
LRPREVCRALLQALEPAQGLVSRRRRDQTPDQVGLSIKRGLLLRAVEDDPAAAEFEAWLVAQICLSEASGPVRAMCMQILDEYHAAQGCREFEAWLEAGAPSDDARPGNRTGECGCPTHVPDQR